MSVSADDRGFLLGDGLFETLLWNGAELVRFDVHAARLARGCAALGLPSADPAALRDAALAAVEAKGLNGRRAAVRLTYSAGPGGRGLDRPQSLRPTLIASAAESEPPRTSAVLVAAEVRRNPYSPTSRFKTLNYLDSVLARREARAAGADEALLLNVRGEVACAAAANLFWFEGDRLLTPALDCGVLDGVVRGAVLAAARAAGLQAAEVAAGPEALERATGLFLTNSLIGVRAVAALDGRTVASDPRVVALARAVTA